MILLRSSRIQDLAMDPHSLMCSAVRGICHMLYPFTPDKFIKSLSSDRGNFDFFITSKLENVGIVQLAESIKFIIIVTGFSSDPSQVLSICGETLKYVFSSITSDRSLQSERFCRSFKAPVLSHSTIDSVSVMLVCSYKKVSVRLQPQLVKPQLAN